MNWERLKTFAFFGACPLILLWLLHLLGASFFQLIFFAAAFYWNMALASSREEDRAETRRYRFSFLKLAYRLHGFVRSRLDYMPEAVIRSVSPLIFAALMAVTAPDWQPLYALLGSAFFEVCFRIKNNLEKSHI